MALVVVATLVLAAAALLARPEADRPVATVGHAGVETTATTAVPARAPAPATTTTTKPKPKTATATRSTTVVRSDAGGVTVVNEGSASASTGGNIVVGPPSATVNEGPVTAVGNSAEVRIRP